MFLLLAGFLMPVLLVFGLYHLLTWFDILDINRWAFWKRVGMASVIAHVLLASGFFVFSYVDYDTNQSTTFAGLGFDQYLFNRSEFWRLMTIFDTASMLGVLGFAAILDRLNINPGGLVALTIAVTLVIGTVQWYFVGGIAGLLLERFWSGLKSPEDEPEEWF